MGSLPAAALDAPRAPGIHPTRPPRRLVLPSGMLIPLLSLLLAQPQPAAATPPAPPLDWAKLESPFLSHHTQLTFRDKYVKAGENYFSPDGKWIIFQAVEAPEKGKEPDPFYAMYVARLDNGKLVDVEKVSPPGSANTCGWFHPTAPGVIFGSTIITPKDEGPSGYQRGTSKYRWAFPAEMDIIAAAPQAYAKAWAASAIKDLPGGKNGQPHDSYVQAGPPKPIFSLPNYDAECSFDKTGRFVLYAHIQDPPKDVDPAKPVKPDADLYIFDTKTQKHHAIVVAPGYDGGPFFSPNNEWICYRSDRRGNDELQLFVAKLAFTEEGGVKIPTGIEYEIQITDNEHVSWCPYWHPSGDYMVYATSEMGHQNYEVFAIQLDREKIVTALKAAPGEKHYNIQMPRKRITSADGADVLPVFTPDGAKMLWCTQRAPKTDADQRPTSQIWIADWKGDPFGVK